VADGWIKIRIKTSIQADRQTDIQTNPHSHTDTRRPSMLSSHPTPPHPRLVHSRVGELYCRGCCWLLLPSVAGWSSVAGGTTGGSPSLTPTPTPAAAAADGCSCKSLTTHGFMDVWMGCHVCERLYRHLWPSAAVRGHLGVGQLRLWWLWRGDTGSLGALRIQRPL